MPARTTAIHIDFHLEWEIGDAIRGGAPPLYSSTNDNEFTLYGFYCSTVAGVINAMRSLTDHSDSAIDKFI